ncbi:hypothetical protein DYB31_004482 [Aphanomyces astaci]|uniref:Major facilitator superfamily (MFS) profile domain-containing protein n=1 Tax=Aphanomyces astaci TaxID=112090 RepID=A0A397FX33_APHAT|nr:hypothetical protein DYB31_004482 [Aphanomyces astaci]
MFTSEMSSPSQQARERDRLLDIKSPHAAEKADEMDVREKHVLWCVCSFILVLETIDSLVFFGISQALKNFTEVKLGYPKATANAIHSTWRSFGDLTPLLGAYLGDELWGRYTSLAVFSVWYVVAMALVSLSAHPYILENHLSFANAAFLIAIFLGVGVARGVYHPNAVTLGADQFDESETDQKEHFFSYFYLAINVGSSVSFGYLTYLSVNGMGNLIPPSYGYFATFTLSGVLLLLAVLLFVAFSSRYVEIPPQEGAFATFFTSVASTMHECRALVFIAVGFLFFVMSILLNAIALFVGGATGLSYSAGICVCLGVGCWIYNGMDPSYLDGQYTRMPVADMQQILRVLPFSCFLVLWQCTFGQIEANFQSIAQQCDLRLGSGRDAPLIPGAMLGLIDTVGVALVIPLLDYVVLPQLKAWRHRPASPYEKVLAGLTLASVTMLWTGVVETLRRNSGELDLNGPVLETGGHQPMNKFSWGYLVPNYFLVSVCEVLVNVTMYDIFYSNVPTHWKSTAQALNAFMLAMGDNLASIFTLLFAPYIPNDLNKGHLEYMYYCLAGVAALNALGFKIVMTRMHFATHSETSNGA